MTTVETATLCIYILFVFLQTYGMYLFLKTVSTQLTAVVIFLIGGFTLINVAN